MRIRQLFERAKVSRTNPARSQENLPAQSIAGKVSVGRLNASRLRSRPADFALGNFAQRNDDVSVVRFDERLGAFEQLSGSFRGELNKDETTGNFL